MEVLLGREWVFILLDVWWKWGFLIEIYEEKRGFDVIICVEFMKEYVWVELRRLNDLIE